MANSTLLVVEYLESQQIFIQLHGGGGAGTPNTHVV